MVDECMEYVLKAWTVPPLTLSHFLGSGFTLIRKPHDQHGPLGVLIISWRSRAASTSNHITEKKRPLCLDDLAPRFELGLLGV